LQVFDDADVVIAGATRFESVTLTGLGAAFPWGEFIPAAVQGALLSVETTNAKLAAVTAERDKLLAAAPTSPVASPAHVEAPAAPPAVEEPVVAPVAVEEPVVAPLEADPAAGPI
jgi:hypothetical protein